MSSDFNKPQASDNYIAVLNEITAATNDLAVGLDPTITNPSNVPTGAKRWNSNNNYWEKFSGSVWGALASVYNIVAAQAVKLQTARNIAITGDISGNANFDGSANVSITASLPNVNGGGGTVGSATQIPVIGWNAKGLITSMSNATINVPNKTSQLTNDSAFITASANVASANYASSAPWSGISGKPAVVGWAWNWSGQGGQPPWLWGSNDGTNFYVYNPSNFSVNYANTAGSVSSIPSSQITGALGFTPYNATNPAGYVNSSGSVAYATNAGNASSANGLKGEPYYDSASGAKSYILASDGGGSGIYMVPPSVFSVNYANSAGSAGSAGSANYANSAGSSGSASNGVANFYLYSWGYSGRTSRLTLSNGSYFDVVINGDQGP